MFLKIGLNIDDDYLLDSMIHPFYYVPEKMVFIFKDDSIDLVCDGTDVARFYTSDFQEYHHTIEKLTIASNMFTYINHDLFLIWKSIFGKSEYATIKMTNTSIIDITVGSINLSIPVYNFNGDSVESDESDEPSVPSIPSVSSLPDGEDVKGQPDVDDLCQTCAENKLCTINLPCGHLYFCIKCSNDYVSVYNKKTCPVCNAKITEIKKFFK